MAVEMEVKLEGGDALINRLTQFERKDAIPALTEGLQEGVDFIAEGVRENIQGFGLVDSGDLLRTVKTNVSKSLANPVGKVSAATGKAFYGKFWERGHTRKNMDGSTTHVPARPFMRKAFEQRRERAVQLMMAKLETRIAQLERDLNR